MFLPRIVHEPGKERRGGEVLLLYRAVVVVVVVARRPVTFGEFHERNDI